MEGVIQKTNKDEAEISISNTIFTCMLWVGNLAGRATFFAIKFFLIVPSSFAGLKLGSYSSFNDSLLSLSA